MSVAIKAADLPDGSMVFYRRPWMKRWQTPAGEWQAENGEIAGNWYIDQLFDLGAVVLREGLS